MRLQGSRVTVRLLNRSDLASMAAWRPFEDPLFADSNWPQRSQQELEAWFNRHSRDPERLLCAITNEEGQMIGSITLRERDGRHVARLGITLGAEFVDQGYGTEALTLFLDFYFLELGFRKMVLDVVAYNQRAIRVYRKLGFVIVGEYEKPVGRESRWSFLQEPEYADVHKYFRRDWLGRYWLLCYDMELTYKSWEARRRELEHIECRAASDRGGRE